MDYFLLFKFIVMKHITMDQLEEQNGTLSEDEILAYCDRCNSVVVFEISSEIDFGVPNGIVTCKVCGKEIRGY